ncbi:hypothetical protein H9L39_19306, partial [Fusarium oxysporum f. sp. albedinis]
REAARDSLPSDENPPDEEPRRERAVDGNTKGGSLLQLPIDSPSGPRPILRKRVPLPDGPRRRPHGGVLVTVGGTKETRRSTFGPSPSSPPDGYRTLSPHSASGMSMHYYPTNDANPRAPTEYSSSNAGEPPNTYHSASTTVASTSINSTSTTDRMSLDGISHPQPTQYLLNSHMNIHSSVRPHYCPVKGCERSEGGKGFKRKNEMIRHGLVHDSPGYVCPFCPDREHKYPRPSTLQRHVRIHHSDKKKDNPQLRDVLAQRPGGSHQMRKIRGPPS